MAIESRHKTNKNFAMSGMTDIVFLLLIFFMIASTLISPASQDVRLPESNNQTQANPVLVISIDQAQLRELPVSEIERIVLDPHQGGAAYTLGGAPFVTLSAGYLGSLFWGVLFVMLGFSRWLRPRWIIGALGIATVHRSRFHLISSPCRKRMPGCGSGSRTLPRSICTH